MGLLLVRDEDDRPARPDVLGSTAAPCGIAARRAPDVLAIERLYRDYFQRLTDSLQAVYGTGPPEPEDVAQRAFAKLSERGDLSSIANLPGFLWRTARNILISDKRASSVRARRTPDLQEVYFPSSGDVLTPDRVFTAREQVGVVMEALRTMPEKRRRIFILNRLEGLSYTEIARRTGIGRTAVTKHVARATADIDAALGER